MAGLSPAPVSDCCSSEQQSQCCEPSEKDGCCTPQSSTCGCPAAHEDVRERVRERYAAAAREAVRVLRGGGRFAISDVIAEPEMDEGTRADMQRWTGCIAGALTRQEFEDALATAGLADVEIRETHRVHEHATAAIIRACKA